MNPDHAGLPEFVYPQGDKGILPMDVGRTGGGGSGNADKGFPPLMAKILPPDAEGFPEHADGGLQREDKRFSAFTGNNTGKKNKDKSTKRPYREWKTKPSQSGYLSGSPFF
jgi:hypothetical protein